MAVVRGVRVDGRMIMNERDTLVKGLVGAVGGFGSVAVSSVLHAWLSVLVLVAGLCVSALTFWSIWKSREKTEIEIWHEMARELLVADRTAAPVGEGLKYSNVGTTQTGYDPKDRRPVISQLAQAMLSKYGAMIRCGSGAVRVVRG